MSRASWTRTPTAPVSIRLTLPAEHSSRSATSWMVSPATDRSRRSSPASLRRPTAGLARSVMDHLRLRQVAPAEQQRLDATISRLPAGRKKMQICIMQLAFLVGVGQTLGAGGRTAGDPPDGRRPSGSGEASAGWVVGQASDVASPFGLRDAVSRGGTDVVGDGSRVGLPQPRGVVGGAGGQGGAVRGEGERHDGGAG